MGGEYNRNKESCKEEKVIKKDRDKERERERDEEKKNSLLNTIESSSVFCFIIGRKQPKFI